MKKKILLLALAMIISVTPVNKALAEDFSLDINEGGEVSTLTVEMLEEMESAGDLEGEHPHGYVEADIEEQIDMQNIGSSVKVDNVQAVNYASSYITPKLPAIRNQGDYGTCWAFSTIALVEINLMKKGTSVDFSELQMAYTGYHSYKDSLGGLDGDEYYPAANCDFLYAGGNYYKSFNALLNGAAPVLESDLPYSSAENVRKNGMSSSNIARYNVHVNAYKEYDTNNIAAIKEGVMTYGAVGINYYDVKDSRYYNSKTAAYYYPYSHDTNHAVTIVGWDDNYSASNFGSNPGKNGAFIVRNSWGTNWGKSGYFYLSYYDESISSTGFALDVYLPPNRQNIYQYDGTVFSRWTTYTNGAKAANVFTINSGNLPGEELTGVTVYMRSGDDPFTVDIYKNLTDVTNPESGVLCAKATCARKVNEANNAGSYMVDLKPYGIYLPNGTVYSVVVTSSNGGVYYDMPHTDSTIVSNCNGKLNQSFRNIGYGWEEFSYANNTNYSIKAYTEKIYSPGYTGAYLYNNSLYRLNNGSLDRNFTGFDVYNGKYAYFKKGILATDYTGFYEIDGYMFALNCGWLDDTYTGLTYIGTKGKWYYLNNGISDFGYTGLVMYNGIWFYVTNGVLDTDYAGLTQYCGVWYYVANGMLDTSYTGLALYDGIWFYVNNGVLDTSYTGLAMYDGYWFYVTNGILDNNYTGLTLYNGIWFYVSNGMLDTYYAGLTQYCGVWYYVSNGMIDTNYYGLTYYDGCWFLVHNGMLDFGYTGLAPYNGSWFYVSNGIVDFSYTGIVVYEDWAYYVINGYLDFAYSGDVYWNGVVWIVVEGRVYGVR